MLHTHTHTHTHTHIYIYIYRERERERERERHLLLNSSFIVFVLNFTICAVFVQYLLTIKNLFFTIQMEN